MYRNIQNFNGENDDSGKLGWFVSNWCDSIPCFHYNGNLCGYRMLSYGTVPLVDKQTHIVLRIPETKHTIQPLPRGLVLPHVVAVVFRHTIFPNCRTHLRPKLLNVERYQVAKSFSKPSCPAGAESWQGCSWDPSLQMIYNLYIYNYICIIVYIYIWSRVKIVYGTFRGVPDVWNEGAS